jgi:hypothetical protein
MKTIYLNRKNKIKIKRIYLSPINQLWANLVTMNTEDFILLKTYINQMDTKNCSFTHYYAKDFLSKLIELSEVYHNK